MKRNILYTLALLINLISACKKNEEPKSYIGTAEFYVKAKLNNSPLLFEAGNDGRVMITENKTDSLNIKEFTGTIGQTCNSCNEKISITFRNYEQASSSLWRIDSLYRTNTNYKFYHDKLAPVGYRVVFNNLSSGIGTAYYTWDFGGGFGSKSENPNFIFNTEGKKDIKLKVDYSGCLTDLESPVYIDNTKLNKAIDFTYKNKGFNVFECTVINADTNTHRFVWRYLNKIESKPSDRTIELPAFVSEGVYKVDLLAINKQTNDTTFVSKNIATAATTKCSANFSYSIVPVRDTLQLSKVIVEYTDKNGVKYSSKYNEQFTGFSIQEISNYKNTATGQKTIKVKLSFSCQLSDGIRTIELKDVNAVLGFAY